LRGDKPESEPRKEEQYAFTARPATHRGSSERIPVLCPLPRPRYPPSQRWGCASTCSSRPGAALPRGAGYCLRIHRGRQRLVHVRRCLDCVLFLPIWGDCQYPARLGGLGQAVRVLEVLVNASRRRLRLTFQRLSPATAGQLRRYRIKV
jgi:hypothetical protein